MGERIKLTLGDGSEISGDTLEDAMRKLQEHKESRRMEKIADVVRPPRRATVDREGNRAR